MINIRQKGQTGERDVINVLEPLARKIMTGLGIPVPEKNILQRNQNQSAVGGADISGAFGLSIEVKRQEQLSINTWWKQCEKSAAETNEIPVLLFRQNGKKWRCVMYAELPLPAIAPAYSATMRARVEFDWEQFQAWFEIWVHKWMTKL